jgi:hypothetical protein
LDAEYNVFVEDETDSLPTQMNSGGGQVRDSLNSNDVLPKRGDPDSGRITSGW